jgi:DNA-binding SARP family transcriptional activator
MLDIQLLGDFVLLSDGSPVSGFTSTRLRSLLAYLLLHRHTPRSRSALAFSLWPDSSEDQAHASLRSLLHLLRHVLPDADRFLPAEIDIGQPTLLPSVFDARQQGWLLQSLLPGGEH